jgi:hypothetical protein
MRKFGRNSLRNKFKKESKRSGESESKGYVEQAKN